MDGFSIELEDTRTCISTKREGIAREKKQKKRCSVILEKEQDAVGVAWRCFETFQAS